MIIFEDTAPHGERSSVSDSSTDICAIIHDKAVRKGNGTTLAVSDPSSAGSRISRSKIFRNGAVGHGKNAVVPDTASMSGLTL
jgi:hypothetical protein